jgi:hypothetical protein
LSFDLSADVGEAAVKRGIKFLLAVFYFYFQPGAPTT